MKISACVLTHNNQETLAKTLESLKFVDEIIIVDDESTDKTLEIAKKYQAKIFSQKLTNFGQQRNYSVEKASNGWIFVIDTDEVVPEKLAKEITVILKNPTKDGYYLPRNTYFLGKPIRHSGWFPDYTIRLFDKNKIKYPENIVHEKAIATENMGYLKNAIDHYSYSDIKTYFDKLNRYTQMQTKRENVSRNHLNILLMLLKPIYRFINMYFVKLGFLDGWRGILLATLSGYYDFKVHYLAEKSVLQKSKPVFWVIFMIVVVIAQGYLVANFGIMALALLLFIIMILFMLGNINFAFALVFILILIGQLSRVELGTGGSGALVGSDIIVPFFLISWVIYKLFKSPKFYRTPMDLSLIAVILIFIVTYIIAAYHGFFGMTSLFYLIRLLMYLALIWPFYDILLEEKRHTFAIKVFEFVLYALVAIGFLQLKFFPSLLGLMKYGWDPHLNRMVATFLDPNFLAAFLCIGFAYFMAKYYSSDKIWYKKILPILIIGLGIALTVSRSGWLMLATILLLFAIFRDKRLFIVMFAVLISVFLFIPRFTQRITDGFDLKGSAALRLGSWKEGYNLIDKNIVYGIGYNNIEQVKLEENVINQKTLESHSAAGVDSSLMVIWSTTGIFGLIIFLYFMFKNIYLGFKEYIREKNIRIFSKNMGLAIAGIFIGLLIHSIFLNSLLYTPIITNLMFVLAIFFVAMRKNEKTE